MMTGTSSGAAISGEIPTPPHQGPFTRWPRSSGAFLATIGFILEAIGILVRTANESGEFTISMVGQTSAWLCPVGFGGMVDAR